VKCIAVSVIVGFLYMSISMCAFLLTILRSRKLMWPLDSSVGVNYRLVCIVLVYNITTTQLLKHNDPETTTQICTILGVILQQNYFIFQEKVYQPNKGIAMAHPYQA